MLTCRWLTTTLLVCTALMTCSVAAALPPEVRKELADLTRELKDVSSLIKKKNVDEAKELIKKVEDKVKELAIEPDEKDRTFQSLKGALEKSRNLIPVSFEKEVAPILQAKCTGCHGGTRAEGDLQLNTFNMIARGGKNGVPVVPKLPARSALTLRLIAQNEIVRMPKGQAKLPDADIQTIARWIEQGASFDGTDRDATIGDSLIEKKPPVEVVMADGSETVSFKNEIAPIIVNICMGCHTGNNPRGKYAMTTFEELLQGGPTGNTIVPGKPDESYIVDLVLRQDPIKMPAGQAQLKQSQAKALEKWIQEGAHFDSTDAKAPLRSLVPTDEEMEAQKLARMSDSEFAALRIEKAAEMWKRVSPKLSGASATTTNFYLYGTVPESRLQSLGDKAESHLAALSSKYPVPPGSAAFRGRLTIFVTADRFDYEEFNTVLMNRRTPKSVSGHSVVTANFESAYLAMHDVGDAGTETTLSAEQLMNSLISQAYLTRDGSSLPDWLRQGFGILESGLEPNSEYVKAIPGRARKALGTITDPGKLFNDGTLAPEEVGDVGYLLIRFLLTQGGPARFQKLVGEFRKSPDAARAIQQTYETEASALGQLFLKGGGR